MPGERKRARTEENIQHSSASVDENVGASGKSDQELPLEQNQVHPLMIDVILKILFEYVKPYNLKACRLVCKKWNILTLPSARSTFATTIHGDFSQSPIAVGHRTADFVKLFGSNCSGIPFTKFILGSFDPTVGHGKQCLQLFGENAKELDLFKTGDFHFIENISAILKSVPNLEYFKIPGRLYSKIALLNRGSHDVSAIKLFSGPESEIPALKCLKTLEVERDILEDIEEFCPTFFKELLNAAENISTIFASHWFAMSSTGLELLKILEKLEREPRIEILSLTLLHGEHLDVLKKMVSKTPGLKLKHLSISQGAFMHSDTLFETLDLLKKNLLSLQVHNNYRFPDNFPRMSELKLLDYKIGRYYQNLVLILNGFKDSFPALQFLRLSSDREVELDEFYVGTESCPLLESLSLGNFILNIQTFERTLDVFPNLKELEMSVTVDGDNILRQMWAQMTRERRLLP